MSKPLLTAAAVLAGCWGADPATTDELTDESAETGRRWIAIGADAIETAQDALARGATGAVQPITIGDAALIEIDARDLRLLSVAMHENHHRCGGFMLYDRFEDAESSLLTVQSALAPTPHFAPSYALDSAALVNAVLPEVKEPNILMLIQQLSANTTRYYTSTTGLAVPAWLRDKWALYAMNRPDVTVELFVHTQFQQNSVIATIPGSTKASEVIVIGGHLDSISSGATAPGADDDASGIAALSEALRALLAKDYHPERTIKFMAYAAEEVGLRGSQDIAAKAKANGTNVVGVLQLDMTNFKGSAKDIYLMQDFTNAAQNTFTGKLIDTYVGATWGTSQCGYGCSDHASWHNQGFATSMPAEATFEDTNPTLHTVNDTLAKSNNNAAQALKFARLTASFAAELGEGTMGGATNTPPTVSIDSPTANQMLPAGSLVQLAGTATDAEDGTISDRIEWSSNVAGALGTGATQSVSLADGVHTITATVQDSAGAVAMATTSVTIGKGNGDHGSGVDDDDAV
jgi:bacterial leucyl aminopeptidase